jgi:DNA-binding transcriptional LysR family regulator
MRRMHESFATAPFDLYELHLLQLIAQRGSFTAAAQAAGLTQSAITRQVQGIEARLGAALFERTTRKVAPTRAGTFLLQEGARLLGSVDALLTRFRHDFTDAAKEVRVGVSTTISMAYLPGFFFAQQRRQPDVRLRIIHLGSVALLERLEANELDVSILCPPRRLPMTLKVCHRFEDRFDLIVPATLKCPEPTFGREKKWLSWLHEQPWLLIAEGTSTGAQLRSWLLRRQWRTEDVDHQPRRAWTGDQPGAQTRACELRQIPSYPTIPDPEPILAHRGGSSAQTPHPARSHPRLHRKHPILIPTRLRREERALASLVRLRFHWRVADSAACADFSAAAARRAAVLPFQPDEEGIYTDRGFWIP